MFRSGIETSNVSFNRPLGLKKWVVNVGLVQLKGLRFDGKVVGYGREMRSGDGRED